MPDLFFKKGESKQGCSIIVSPDNSSLKLITFGLINLSEGGTYSKDTDNSEVALDILSGRCSVEINTGGKSHNYENIGERKDVFSGKPTMVYIPRNSSFKITAKSGVEIAIAWTPARKDFPPGLIAPGDVAEKIVGKDNWQRKVYSAIDDRVEADRLLVGETINPPGNWSSAPPHKHDEKYQGVESPMEEVYYYRTNPPQGFGIQRIYTDKNIRQGVDEAYVVKTGDTVALPYGYHPVVAGPGYSLFYLWVLSGEERCYGAWRTDPEHEWLLK